jgi:hypothetical protein
MRRYKMGICELLFGEMKFTPTETEPVKIIGEIERAVMTERRPIKFDCLITVNVAVSMYRYKIKRRDGLIEWKACYAENTKFEVSQDGNSYYIYKTDEMGRATNIFMIPEGTVIP